MRESRIKLWWNENSLCFIWTSLLIITNLNELNNEFDWQFLIIDRCSCYQSTLLSIMTIICNDFIVSFNTSFYVRLVDVLEFHLKSVFCFHWYFSKSTIPVIVGIIIITSIKLQNEKISFTRDVFEHGTLIIGYVSAGFGLKCSYSAIIKITISKMNSIQFDTFLSNSVY